MQISYVEGGEPLGGSALHDAFLDYSNASTMNVGCQDERIAASWNGCMPAVARSRVGVCLPLNPAGAATCLSSLPLPSASWWLSAGGREERHTAMLMRSCDGEPGRQARQRWRRQPGQPQAAAAPPADLQRALSWAYAAPQSMATSSNNSRRICVVGNNGGSSRRLQEQCRECNAGHIERLRFTCYRTHTHTHTTHKLTPAHESPRPPPTP